MCVYMCVCVYIYIHTYIYIYTHTHICYDTLETYNNTRFLSYNFYWSLLQAQVHQVLCSPSHQTIIKVLYRLHSHFQICLRKCPLLSSFRFSAELTVVTECISTQLLEASNGEREGVYRFRSLASDPLLQVSLNQDKPPQKLFLFISMKSTEQGP